MRDSVLSVIFALALSLECYTPSMAIPMGKMEDTALEQDTLDSLLNEEVAEKKPDSVRSGSSKIIVLADSGLWKNLNRGLPLYKLKAAAAGLDRALTLDRKEADQDLSPSISIVRRDTMRCMVGRVYRPCWEV
ncbi:pro-MCH 2 [Salmo salar]|uniref:Pro-MCH 2 n=1 Tax=Salmo salar TaxID=8030 RepID=A0A1S3L070_SALSA|nr:pro-MCH 2 [Salmo salar]|eukprot:XP_013984342.1 PREDICTED: pro-MCH 2 [Salmo salar]